MFFSGFSFISTHISLDLISLGSAKAYSEWGGKLNGLFDGKLCQNCSYKNYQNLMIDFQVTVKNVVDVFLRHSVCVFVRAEKFKRFGSTAWHEPRLFSWRHRYVIVMFLFGVVSTPCLKKQSKLFFLQPCQTSTEFDIFWHKKSQDNRIV